MEINEKKIDAMIYSTLLLWIAYSCLEGVREGYYWNLYPSYKINIHTIFFIQRSFVLLIISLLNPVSIIALSLIFSFFHNGSYYLTRNKLNSKVYPKKWFDQSKNSTSWMTKFNTPISRSIQLFIGLLILVLHILGTI